MERRNIFLGGPRPGKGLELGSKCSREQCGSLVPAEEPQVQEHTRTYTTAPGLSTAATQVSLQFFSCSPAVCSKKSSESWHMPR